MSSGKLNGEPSNFDTLPFRSTTLSIGQFEGFDFTDSKIYSGKIVANPGYISYEYVILVYYTLSDDPIQGLIDVINSIFMYAYLTTLPLKLSRYKLILASVEEPSVGQVPDILYSLF